MSGRIAISHVGPHLQRLAKCAISLFIVANVGTVLFVNQPNALVEAASERISWMSPRTVYRLRLSRWYVLRYAHLVGLDSRWQMFGHQSRFNWWYIIDATYSDGPTSQTVRLPLPRQGQRTLWQRYLFDFREAKFHMNIYSDPIARESYSRYLAHRFPTHEGLPVQTIRWRFGYQTILEPDVSVRERRLVDPNSYIRALNEFDVRRGHGVGEVAPSVVGEVSSNKTR